MKRILSAALCAALAFTFIQTADAAPQKPPRPPAVDFKPYNQAVTDAVKSGDKAKIASALNALEALPEDTPNKINTLCSAAVSVNDPVYSHQYLLGLFDKVGNDRDRGLVAWRIARNLTDLAKAIDNKRAAVKITRSEFDTYFAQAEALEPKAKGSMDVGLVNAACALRDPRFADAYITKALKKELSPKDRASIQSAYMRNIQDLGKLLANEGDRAGFDALYKQIQQMPPETPAKISTLARMALNLDGARPLAELDRMLAGNPSPAERFALLDAKRSLFALSPRPYEFLSHNPDPDTYAKWRSVLLEMVGLLEQDAALPPKEHKIPGQYLSRFIGMNMNQLMEFGDYATAEKLLAVWHKDAGDGDASCAVFRVRNLLRQHKDAEAEAVVNAFLKASQELLKGKLSNHQKNQILEKSLDLKALIYLTKNKDCSGLDAAVYGAEKPVPADRYRMLMRASADAYRANRNELCFKIFSEIHGNMFDPVKRNTFRVVYQKNPPQTADAWSRTYDFTHWSRLDTRFVPYGDMYQNSPETDIKCHLKGAVPGEIPPENRAGLQFFFDDYELHIFVRVSDPDIGEVRDGKRKGPGFEMLFRPGSDAAYHTDYLLNTPDTAQTFPQDWQRPGKDYTSTRDLIRRDIAMTNDSMAVHYAIPWYVFHSQLPGNGREWTFGLQVWGKTALTCSGAVHELSRMGTLDIRFTPEQSLNIRKNIARHAFNQVAKMFAEKGELPRLWEDDVLGDPAFYEQEVKPLFDRLQKAAEEMPQVPDAKFGEFYRKHVPLAMTLKYIVAEKRAAYLRNSLLK